MLSLSDTLLLRLPGWYRIINTVATHPVLKGGSAVAQQKVRFGLFPNHLSAPEATADGLQSYGTGQHVGACWSQVVTFMFWKKVLELAVAFWSQSWELLCSYLK